MFERILYSLKYRFNKLNTKIDTGKYNKISNQGSIIGSKIEFFGNNNELIIGENTVLENAKICFRGNHCRLVIGKSSALKSCEFYLEDEQVSIIIGNQTTIEQAQISVTENNSIIEIGDDCMFANNIDIRNGDSHSIYNIEDKMRINFAKNIKIGNHIWLGNQVIILKGVSIGNQSIVAAGSIVTKSFGENLLIGGNTAEIIKENITWERERI